jgi:CheY-like chemotaxis protein
MSFHVLIVDDDKHTCKILQTLITRDPVLKQHGVTTQVASDGALALKALDERPADLVISDLLMPGMDGFTFCRELRRREGGEDVPLIVTSAVYRDAVVMRKLRVEVDAEFFTKPFQVAELIAAVRRLLRVEPGAAPQDLPQVAAPRPGTSGRLADYPMPRLMLDLFESRTSACLRLVRGAQRRCFHLLLGHVVGAESSSRADALGTLLLCKGLLTEEQLREALAATRDQGRQIGQVLVERGWVSEAQLMRAMELQMQQRITHVLRWQDAAFHLEPPRPAYERINLPGGTPQLLFSGLRATARADQLQSAWQQMQGFLRATPRAARLREPFEQAFGPGSLDVLEASAPLKEVIARLPRAERDALCVRIDAILLCGMGTLEQSAAAPRPPQPALAPVPPAAVLSTPTPAPEQAAQPLDPAHRQLLAEYLAADGRDLYQLLDLPRDLDPSVAAGVGVIQAAYRRALDRLSPERFRDIDLGPDYGKISELRERYHRAFLVLSSPARRAAYDRDRAAVEQEASAWGDAASAELLFREGLSKLQQGDLPAAQSLLEQAVARIPDQADYQALLGWICFLTGRQQGLPPREAAQGAWPYLQEALLIDDAHCEAHAYLGHIDVALGEDERAAAHFMRVLDAHPERIDVLGRLERVLYRSGRQEELAACLYRLIQRMEGHDTSSVAPLLCKLARLCSSRLADLRSRRSSDLPTPIASLLPLFMIRGLGREGLSYMSGRL